jgi:3-methyladenine DNA glycosylase AlkD
LVEEHRAAISLTPHAQLLDALWNGGTYEERLLALRFLIAFRGLLGEREWGLLTKWSETAENWSLADWIAHVRGWLLRRYPERVTALINWCASPNVFVRRAAVVSLLIYDPEEKERTQVSVPVRQALRVIEAAMKDPEPIVQKAVVWVAKEIGSEAPEQLARMLEENAHKAPKAFTLAAAEGLPERLRRLVTAALNAPPPPPPVKGKKNSAAAGNHAKGAQPSAAGAKDDAKPAKPVTPAKPAKGAKPAASAQPAKPAKGKPAAPKRAKSATPKPPRKPAPKSRAKTKPAARAKAKTPSKKPKASRAPRKKTRAK